MTDTFKLRGDVSSGPAFGGSPSGFANVLMSIDEVVQLASTPVTGEYALAADSPVSVSFGALTGASVVIVKSIGGKVRVRLTSSDGSSQAIAVDSFAVIISDSVPYTAVDLTRNAGVATTVKVLLGQAA